jgi:hypothetical protein
MAAHHHNDHHAHGHHHVEESNLRYGLIGIAVAVVGLAIIMGIAYWLASPAAH